jgi:hypothetical protein
MTPTTPVPPARALSGFPLLTLLAAIALTAVPAAAQGRRTRPSISLEAGGVYAAYRGSDFELLNAGPGFDAQANIGVNNFSIGGGYLRTTHDVAGSDNDAVMSGFYVEPRLALDINWGNFTPYLLGRVARIESSTDDLAATGTSLGGGVGLLMWIAPGTQINSSVAYSATRLTADSGAHTTGDGLTLRLGISLFGTGWGRDEYAP